MLSPGIHRIPGLRGLLGAELEFCSGPFAPRRAQAVLGWGRRRSTRRSRAFARRHGLPFVGLEDGFLRSVGLGRDDPPLSVVLDDEGIYYDARQPSRLDRLLGEELDEARIRRAAALAAAWREQRVSKYNYQRDTDAGELPPRFVLVADQTRGDASVAGGLADQASFARMLRAALDENPACTVLVKTHPDVFAGKARGWIDTAQAACDPRVRVLARDVHPATLLARAAAVYVVTSQLGFEALLHGVPVRTFGMPFYAGRGLSRDELPAPAWRRPVTLEQLVHAALIAYPRYRDPESGEACEAETVLAHLGLQRRQRARFAPQAYATGFSPWKRPLVRRFVQGSRVHFVRRAEAAPSGTPLLVWGAPAPGAAREVVRLEDGFLRSVGLGADLVAPLSWVMDRRGIYYDASCPSDLEVLLQQQEFDAALLARAAVLRQRIVAGRLSKYNLGGGRWQRPAGATQVVLVPGQVETDAAIVLGAPGIRSNLELLRAVRAERPDAYLVYKPHPDVVAGLRRGGAPAPEFARLCDRIVTDCAIEELFDAVDEVHVLSSLTGFEALLRERPVVCHGQPFYAGWGLTKDRLPIARRARRLELDELVAGVLLLYPTYVSRRSGRFTTAERALDELVAWRDGTRGSVSRPLRTVLRLRAWWLGL